MTEHTRASRRGGCENMLGSCRAESMVMPSDTSPAFAALVYVCFVSSNQLVFPQLSQPRMLAEASRRFTQAVGTSISQVHASCGNLFRRVHASCGNLVRWFTQAVGTHFASSRKLWEPPPYSFTQAVGTSTPQLHASCGNLRPTASRKLWEPLPYRCYLLSKSLMMLTCSIIIRTYSFGSRLLKPCRLNITPLTVSKLLQCKIYHTHSRGQPSSTIGIIVFWLSLYRSVADIGVSFTT